MPYTQRHEPELLAFAYHAAKSPHSMTVDLTVIPGLLLLAAELLALAAVGYVAARVALRQRDHSLALAQGVVIGLALWGLVANFILHLLPGLAGALAGWIVVLGLGLGLAWHGRRDIRPSPRMLAAFSLAGAGVFWLALASRQLLIIPDHLQHTLIPAAIRAGNWPPRLPWNPDLNLAYHHGVDLLAGLLTPPTGPDVAFTTEVLGAYAWTGLTLLVATILLRRGSRLGALTLTPLLLAGGAWTLAFGDQPSVLRIPVPGGIPEAGLRATLAELYWPRVELPWPSEQHGVPPNIWKPSFPLAYALALVTLERANIGRIRHWSGALSLAGLVGFLGLVDEAVAAVVLLLWAVIEGGRLLQHRGGSVESPTAVLCTAAGPALGALLLVGAGGVFTGVLTEGSQAGGLSLGAPLDPRDRNAAVSVQQLPGGVGLLELGSLAVAAVAVALERRNGLVIALALGAAAFLLAALTVRYEIAPYDVARLDGHARNFALLALLLALSVRLAAGRLPWRVTAATAIFLLAVWPAVSAPARQLGLVAGTGVQLSNAEPGDREFDDWYWWMGRYALLRFPSEPIAGWIREHSEADARVLSPAPYAMTVATGRPNASGFHQYLHLIPYSGPEYLDAIRHLEPAALRRLNIGYIHAPDDWVGSLPNQARIRLDNPGFFDLLLRDGTHSLYGVKPLFLTLDDSPSSRSYEALRHAAPAGVSVYVSPAIDSLNAFRAMAMLTHTNLLETEERTTLNHLRVNIQTESIGNQTPDLVLTSSRLAPSAFALEGREPVWWNEDSALYSPSRALAPSALSPPRLFSVQLSNAAATHGRLTFTATFSNRTTGGWSGQDWVVIPADAAPWNLPSTWPTDTAAQWYAGQISPQSGTATHGYEFDPRAATLAIRGTGAGSTKLPASGDPLDQGVWILAVRLRNEYQLAALVPTVIVTVADSGEVSFRVHEGELAIQPAAGPVTSPERTF